MATISIETVFAGNVVGNICNKTSGLWNNISITPAGDLSPGDSATTTIINSGTTLQAVYRGLLASAYVYSTGSPPGGGATNIVIVGYV